MAPHSNSLPGKSYGRRSPVGCSPWGRSESDRTELLHFDFSLSCIGEGNGNPLQRSCLENPRDRGAWQAAIYGVAQSQTQLKRLSSSSSSSRACYNFQCKARQITLLAHSWKTLVKVQCYNIVEVFSHSLEGKPSRSALLHVLSSGKFLPGCMLEVCLPLPSL